MSFFAGGITKPSQDAILLYAYLFFLGRRVELWLLFLAAVTAGVSVYLSPRDGRERAIATATIAGAVITMAVWWLPHAYTHLDPRRNHFIARNLGVSGVITPDDIDLASWMEHSLTPDKGLIGLTSIPFKFGATKLLFPIGASQALPLYGKGYNFTFQVYDPSRAYSYDEYTQHVVNFLDAQLVPGEQHPVLSCAEGRFVSQSWTVAGTGNWFAASGPRDFFLWCLRGSSPTLESSPVVDSEHHR